MGGGYPQKVYGPPFVDSLMQTVTKWGSLKLGFLEYKAGRRTGGISRYRYVMMKLLKGIKILLPSNRAVAASTTKERDEEENS